MKRKALAWILILCMIFSSMPMSVFASEVPAEENAQVISEENIEAQSEEDTDAPQETATLSDDLIIDNADELLAFVAAVNAGDNFAGKVVKLGDDIDLTGVEWTPIGGESVYFAGEFDGQDKTISNLTQTTGARMGLFGLVEKSYIHDLTLENVNFTVAANNARVGAIAGNLQYWNVVKNVTIDGIKITANGNDGLIGAVTGYAWKSQLGNVDVKNAEFTVNGTGNVLGGHTAYGRAHVWDKNVTGNNAHWLEGTVQTIDGVEYVLQNYFTGCDVDGVKMTLNGTGSEAGGFFGSDTYNSHSNYFASCHVTGLDITAAAGTSQTVGGFIAWNNGTTSAGTVKGFDNCSAAGTIKGADGIYGGFVAQVGGRACEYDNASADVDITCTGTVGGFVGATQAYSTHKYTFTDCAADGDVTGNVAGGFAGKNGMSGDGKSVFVELNGCSATGTVNGTTYAGGLIGEVNTELPATNWNIVDSTGSLVLTGNTASPNVTGGTAGALIGYFDGVANGDAKEGNTVKVVLLGNNPAEGINCSDDTVTGDIILNPVAQVGNDYFASLEDAVAAANAVEGGATVELKEDVALGEMLTISGAVTITGGKTITWADGYNGTLFNVESGATLNLNGVTIDGDNAFTFYNDTTTVENGQNWYTRFVNVGDEDKKVKANVIVNAGNLTLGEGTKIKNVTIASDSENGKTKNTETGGYNLMYNDDLAIIKSNGGEVTMTVAEITGNAGLVLNAVNTETAIEKATIDGNMGCGNKGGIIIANGGTMAITDSSICGNKAMARSATILGVINGAKVTFSGTMNNNKHIGVGSNTAGAMVVLEGASQFVMSGGSISDNVGGRAGAIASRWVGGSFGQHEDTSIVLNAGEVKGNTASHDSWNGASVFLRSPATIGEGMTVDGLIAVNAAPGELEITGGTFDGSLTVAEGLSAEITGGTFSYDPSAWLAPTAAVTEENGAYIVVNSDSLWTIRSVEDLKAFAAAVNAGDTFEGKKVVLATDINLTDTPWTPIGGWDGSVQFLGEFDGNKKTIHNLTIDDTNVTATKYRAGLFADLGKGSSVHDLTLKNVKVTSTKGGQVGALAGRSGANLENVYVEGFEANAASGAYVGAVVGITNYYDAGDYGFSWKNVDAKDVKIAFTGTKTSYGGGLLGGMNPNGARLNTYEDCDVTNVTITDENIGWHGGMWGWHGRSGAFNYVKNCTVTNVNITTKGTGESRIGGVCGFVGVSGGLFENVHVNGGKLTAGGGFAGGFTPWSYAWGQDTFKNCSVKNVDVTCATGVAAGFIAAAGAGNQTSKCIDCTVEGGTVTGRIASGFAGIDRHGNAGGAYVLDGCTSSATVKGTEYAAGLIARASSSYQTIVTGSEFTGTVSGEGYVCDGVITTHTDKSLVNAEGVNVLYTNIKDATDTPVVEKTLAKVTFTDDDTGKTETLVYTNAADARFDSLQKLIGTNDYADFVLGATQSELLAYVADGRASDITLTLFADLEESLVLPNKYFDVPADYDITINLNGFKLTSDSEKKTVETFVDTEIINGTVSNTYKYGRAIDMRGDVDLELTDVALDASGGNGQALTVGGDVGEGNRASVIATNTNITAMNGYGVIVYNPVDMTLTDSVVTGYGALYFKAANGSQGSAGSVVNAENTEFNSMNLYTAATNEFGTMVFEDKDITVDMTGGQISVVNKLFGGGVDQFAIMIKADVENIAVTTDKDTAVIYGNGNILTGYDYDEDHTIVLPATADVKAKVEAEGYKFEENATEGTLEVIEYVEWVKAELLAGNDVTLDRDIVVDDYELVNALKLPSNGNGKYDERHGNGAVFHIIKPGVVLDLNGHSITWDAHHDDYCNKRQVSLFMVTATGNEGETADFTVKDSVGTGKVDVYGMGTGVYTVCVGAKSTIEGGTWTNYPCKTCGASNIFLYPSHGGEMYITGGTFEQKDSEYLLGMKGSTKETTNNGVGTDFDATKVEISGGTFVGMNPGEIKFFDTAGSGQTVTDGCAEGFAPAKNSDGTYTVKPLVTVEFDDVTIVKGNEIPKFTYKTNFTEVSEDGEMLVVEEPEVTVNGAGEYEITAEAYVFMSDKYVVRVEPGTLTVVEAVAAIGDTYYASLEKAIAAVQNDETITLLAKCDENVTIKQVANKSFTIDGKDNTYTGTITVDGNKRSAGAETLTIKNMKFVADTASQIFIEAKSGTYAHNITVDGCTFTGDAAKTAYGMKVPNSYNIVIKNCEATKMLDAVYSNKAVTGFTAENVKVTDSVNGFYMSYVINAAFKAVAVTASNIGVYVNNYNASVATFENCHIDAKNPVVLQQKNETKAFTLTFNGTNVFNATGETGAWLTVEGADAMLKAVINDEGLDMTKTSGLVAQIGNVYYNTLQNAIKDAADDAEIVVLKDINIADEKIDTLDEKYDTYYLVEGKNVTIDLNGKTISGEYTGDSMLVGVFSTDNNGHLVLTGNGTVNVTTGAESTVYSLIANYEPGCSITIENGTYKLDKASDSLIYTGGNEDVIIEDGTFTLGNVGTGKNKSPWIFNAKGQNTAHVMVYGGTYNAEINHQYYPFEVEIPNTHVVRNNNDGTWTVVPGEAVASVNEQEKSGKWYTHEVGYATIEEAIAAAKAQIGRGDADYVPTVTLLKDCEDTQMATVVPTGVTLDLNGHTLTAGYVASFGDIIDVTSGGMIVVPSARNVYVVEGNGAGKTTDNEKYQGYLPIFDVDNSAYKFFEYQLVHAGGKAPSDDPNAVKFGFRIFFNESVSREAYELLAKSAEGLNLDVGITWGNRGTVIKYSFTKELIEKYATQTLTQVRNEESLTKALTVTIRGLNTLKESVPFYAEPTLSTEVGTSCTIDGTDYVYEYVYAVSE